MQSLRLPRVARGAGRDCHFIFLFFVSCVVEGVCNVCLRIIITMLK